MGESDISVALDWIRRRIADRLEQAGLLTLKSKLEAHSGRRLKSSFFFGHNTPVKVVDYFCAGRRASDTVVSQHLPASPDEASSEAPAEIAIVGVARRLPQGIDGLDALWDVLDSQREVISEYPASRGDWPRSGIERGGFLLIDDLAVEEIRHYPDHERSTNSTGMW